MSDLDVKLSAARTRLILEKPFLGALVMRLPMKEGDKKWCETTATDAKAFYYNPEYIEDLSLGQTQFMLAHEALHCALSHFARRQSRMIWKWDLACDFAINSILVAEGLAPPPNAVIMPSYEGMTAEEIYPLIDDTQQDQKPLDNHLYDEDNQKDSGSSGGGVSEDDLKADGQTRDDKDEGKGGGAGVSDQGSGDGESPGASQPPPLTLEEKENLGVQWQQRMAGAAQLAQQAGKLTGSLARMIDHLLQPQLPWRMLLARYMSVTARNDYTWMRPSRRETEAMMPSLRSSEVDVVVIVDISGSIGGGEFNEFISEINAIKGQVKARVTLHGCDSHMATNGPWVFESWEPALLPKSFEGGGGTSFMPPFEWLEREAIRPDLLVYFTDAEGPFPELEPNFPVIWLVKGKSKVPWGQRIQLN